MTRASYLPHQVVTVTSKVAVTQTIIRTVTQAVHPEILITNTKAVVHLVIPVVVQVVLVQMKEVLKVTDILQKTLIKITHNSSPYFILFFNNIF